ncbi:WbqC family protein [Acidobacteriota bacterium]
MKRVCSIHQPHYLPWLRYFDKIARADIFILLDDAQFNKNGWQNRNKIKGPEGWLYLTTPIRHKHRQAVLDVMIDTRHRWPIKHWKSIETCYRRARFFDTYIESLMNIYQQEWVKLIDLVCTMLDLFNQTLGIDTPVLRSSELGVGGAGTQRLLDLCHHVEATHYLAGSYSAGAYFDFDLFRKENIEVILQDWTAPFYKQLYPKAGFIPDLSILDLLLNHGPESLNIILDPERQHHEEPPCIEGGLNSGR